MNTQLFAQANTTLLPVLFTNLGVQEYKTTWDFQEKLLAENLVIKQHQRTAEINKEDYTGPETKSYFLFVEHPAVFTLGKSGSEDHLLLSKENLVLQNIAYFKTNRGGDITYHGPGQIVGYPILDLEKIKPDIVWYMRTLEEVIIQTLHEFGIIAERLEGATGVWLDASIPHKARKICAMGVRTSRWITMHGFALNVNTNLDHFNFIVPCGITDKQVTSMQQELGKEISMIEVQNILLKKFESCFEVKIIEGVNV
jgi:lipoyl(octanoyl) transferase